MHQGGLTLWEVVSVFIAIHCCSMLLASILGVTKRMQNKNKDE